MSRSPLPAAADPDLIKADEYWNDPTTGSWRPVRYSKGKLRSVDFKTLPADQAKLQWCQGPASGLERAAYDAATALDDLL